MLNLQVQKNNSRRQSDHFVKHRIATRNKRQFVEEGFNIALGRRQGKRTYYERKADGVFEASLIARSHRWDIRSGRWVAGRPGGATQLH